MGLDMYLYTRGEQHNPYPEFDPEYKTDLHQVAYWRKANQVHRFFVELNDGVDECQETPVTMAAILDLRDRCRKIAADHTQAEELLPPMSGFFFGSTEIDEWYFHDIEDTIKQLDQVIVNSNELTTFVYQSSW